MGNLRKSFPGPYQVEKYKITVHTLEKHPKSNFENFRLRAQKPQQKFWHSNLDLLVVMNAWTKETTQTEFQIIRSVHI